MLVNFRVENYRSFKEMSEFSMVAGGVRRHPSHVDEIGGKAVLRSAFVFGANAGGKSNFVRAIAFASRVVNDGLERESCDRSFFRLASGKERKDVGVFQFTIFTGGRFYEYGIAVSYSKASLVAEWLSLVGDETKTVFSFDWESKPPEQPSDFDLDEYDRQRYEVYSGDACACETHKKTFLSEIADKGGGRKDSPFFSHFAAVRNWFRRLFVIFPNSWYGGFRRYIRDAEARHILSDQLAGFDTGIKNLDTHAVEAERIFEKMHSPELCDELKADLISALTGKDKLSEEITISKFVDGNSYLVRYVDGQLRFEKVVANHGEADQPFDREDESDGTQRLFDLLPLLKICTKDAVVVVDELDRSLHTKATHEFIGEFFGISAGKHSQLIATTHDASVLDLDLLRQDEIWFVERGQDNASRLYPLTKFKPRFDKDVRKDYLLGRYGALPIFRACKLI